MSKFFTSYFISLAILLMMDGLWLGVVAKSFYAKQIGFLMTDKVNWLAAFLFYVVFAIGITVFVVLPNMQSGNIGKAFLMGALLGLVAYAAYDFTNQATIKNWPYFITIIDLAWGTVIAGVTSAATMYLLSLIK